MQIFFYEKSNVRKYIFCNIIITCLLACLLAILNNSQSIIVHTA